MKRFLSRLRIGKSAIASRGITNPYRLHQLVWTLFPGQEPGRIGHLFGFSPTGDGMEVMILSDERPKAIGNFLPETKELPTDFLDHGRYRFAITANPVKCEPCDGRRRGKRRTVSPREVEGWFIRKLSDSGCAVESIIVGGTRVESFRKSSDGDRIVTAYSRATGVIAIRDREKFRRAFDNGVGPSKRFGCGMLQVRPIRPI